MASAITGLFLTVLAPLIGLGEQNEFLFFQWWGLTRSDVGVLCLQIILAACVVLSVIYGASKLEIGSVTQKYWAKSRAPDGTMLDQDTVSHLSKNRSTVSRWVGDCFYVLRMPVGRLTEAVGNIWPLINRDWMVVLFLAPFSLYIVVYWIVAFPEVPWIAPDSFGYLVFFPHRTLFYPLFLRLVAAVFEDPNALVAIQLLTGIFGVVFLAEVSQRLFRNVLVTIPAGVFLLFNWPMIEHAFFLLTDYLFFGVVCFQFGAALLVVQRCTARRLVLLAVVTALVIAVRPAGMFLLGVMPFVLIVWPRYWRRVTGALIIPLVFMVGLQMGAHKVIYGYFGVSASFGYSTLSNTLLVLKPDTPFPYPKLIEQLYEFARPYQIGIAAKPDYVSRTNYNTNVSNPLINGGSNAVMAYGAEHGLITLVDELPRRRFVSWLNELSPLNQEYKRLGIATAPNWIWLDEILGQLAVSSILNNPVGSMETTWDKLQFGWDWVIPNFLADTRYPPRHPLLQRHLPRIGFEIPYPADAMPTPVWTNMTKAFNWVANWLNRFGAVVSIQVTVLMAGVVMLIAFAWYAVRLKKLPATVSALAYLSGCLFIYHFEVSMGSVPIPRLLTPMIGASMILYFSPLLLFGRSQRRRMAYHLASLWARGG